MLRTHNCGELDLSSLNKEVTLCGWIQRSRDLGGMTFIDLRDRYGVTQLVFNMEENRQLCGEARGLGREYVISVKGKVIERTNKNPKLPTGDIEIKVSELKVLNPSKVPPFILEDETDGGEDLRARYRYLDLRRSVLRKNLELRHRVASETRRFLDAQRFIEVETPVLIKSTPEGARDFVVPSRMNPGEFYALPQSPQTFKQLLMVSGLDRYYQIVKCFRDEDLRADRQPEFTQIDCEMSFVEREDILQMFENLVKHLFKEVKGIDIGPLPRMSYAEALKMYGSDKPDTRFGMEFVELKGPGTDPSLGWVPDDELFKAINRLKPGFRIFDEAELVAGINAGGCGEYTRKQLDELTAWVKRPQIGANGLVYVKCNPDGSFKSSVDKFFSQGDLREWAAAFGARPGDLLLILAGKADKTRKALAELRLEMGERLGKRPKDMFSALWVLDFPLLEWDEESERWYAMHHPFTSANSMDLEAASAGKTGYGQLRANAYDMVINGTEVGGGSIRIHDRGIQKQMFDLLGLTEEEIQKQFGFLMDAFEYGAPPHGGIAFGFDRLVSVFAGLDSIRDVIAFPKNNSGRDVMIDSPSGISQEQLKELQIESRAKNQNRPD